jgi:tripartite-type tricarboxylate transporter receptor subunit TctC
MKAPGRSRVVSMLFVLAALALPAQLAAQSYPARPVRVIVPFPPGGGTDVQARVIFKELNEQFKQVFLIDNRGGAGGIIGADAVVRSPPDGYTFLFTSASLAVNATLSRSTLKFDPVKDLAPVAWVTSTPLVLIVNPANAAKSAAELTELVRTKPGQLNAAINVPGSTSHLAAEMFKQLAGLNFTTVPYKGGALSMMAVVAGEVHFQFAEAVLVMPQLKAGKVRALAVTTANPSATFPDLPTMNTGLPGFVADQWFAMFAPAGTPRDIVATINGGVKKALETPSVRALFEQDGVILVGSTPEELGTYFRSEIERYAEIIRKGNITAQ